jgi:hypothetical protein
VGYSGLFFFSETVMPDIRRDEFENWMNLLRDDIQGVRADCNRDFSGVHARLDLLNGRTRLNERDIAVLQAARDTEPEEQPLTRRDLKIVVGAISGAVTVCGVLLKFGGALFHAAVLTP